MSPLDPSHNSTANSTPTPKRHWRSLDELEDSPEFRAFAEAEFPIATDPQGISRRRWLQVMGASFALAGVGGCWPREEILPFAKRPADRVPGEPDYYATAMDRAGVAIGLRVTSVDGRPIKIEGNPLHPESRGATDAAAQASILQLYDPDRSQRIVQLTSQGNLVQKRPDNFLELFGSLQASLEKSNGSGFRILAEANGSPTLARLRNEFLERYPQAAWHEYEPFGQDNERQGTQAAFGKPYRPIHDLDRARVIVCLDADLLGSHPAAVQNAGGFAKGREVVDGRMNRLYAIESGYSITGAAADHRLPMRSSQIAAFAQLLHREVVARIGEIDRPADETEDSNPVGRFLQAVANDLLANRGECLVAVGPGQPAEVHALVHAVNQVLENVGKTVRYVPAEDPQRPTYVDSIKALVDEMKSASVETLLILGGNPVYNAPVDVEFADAMTGVEMTIHLSQYLDETSRTCSWHIPEAHFLEAWGDARTHDGTYSVVQPLIEPLGDGKSAIEILGLLLGRDSHSGPEVVRETFDRIVSSGDTEQLWRKTVHDGLLPDSQWEPETPAKASVPESTRVDVADLDADAAVDDLEIVFFRDASVHDGRHANNGWLQETPDPMTKLTWDNAALIAPGTAKALGVKSQEIVKLGFQGREVEMPVYVLSGQAPGSVAVALGYGRTSAGRVGGNESEGVAPVGVDLYPLRDSDAMHWGSGLTIESTGRSCRLATTQDHFAVDTVGLKAKAQRLGDLVRQADLEEYLAHPNFAQHLVHHPPLESLWEEHAFEGHRWGMSIDLSKCIGCNACTVACQAENNIPIVGKERVLEGREMHWIRIDRYFQGEDSDRPAVAYQPVACQHCEMAPCEQVCPVAATVHSDEGLNDMIYNRCIGTRYCSNNCPYKVRRFNYFNYHKDIKDRTDPKTELAIMVHNPEVTVRQRGVMEKCSYCVQRIQAAKIDAKKQNRPMADGQVKTACQQACPTQAIVFGDLSDPKSRVAQTQADPRAYGMLAELNVKPRTNYMAKIRNPNPELEEA